MWIYKITNKVNNKMYIGQSAYSIQKRFKRHINDALSNRLDTHLCRAIRKYGPENFCIEEIDTASSQEELNQKEHDWINYYDSLHTGYNETNSMLKCGGNTYINKTKEEMDDIKEKIRQSKMGEKNPNHRKVIQTDLITGEQIIFGSMQEGARYHGVKNKAFIQKRCNKEITTPYHKRYMFEDYKE